MEDSTSVCRGESGVVTERPEAEREMAAAVAGAVEGPGAKNKAAAAGAVKVPSWSDLDSRAAAKEPKKKKKTVVEEVTIEYIRKLEARGPLPIRDRSSALLCPAESPEDQELLDDIFELQAWVKALHDKETAILEQYRKYGYAYEMFEVDDSDDEEGLSQAN